MYHPLDSRHAQYSARKRVLKHLHKQKTAFETKQKGSPVKPAAKPGEDPDPDSHAPKGLEPGTIQLKSFYSQDTTVQHTRPEIDILQNHHLKAIFHTPSP
jgi:hypothetical protein